MEKDKYSILAEQLAMAIDIGNEVIRKFPPKGWNEGHITHVTKLHDEWKEDALKYKNMSSLKELIHMAFTRFQEGGGADVEYFWSKIKEQNLPFNRENKMEKILKRKKLNNIGEYDFVIDTMIPYKQERFINENDIVLLNMMIDKFEQKHKS